ncbi:MAG: glycosyltransferase [Bacilli bacterium]|nr:glycosyltransferase [Bacilli bacterium]
MPKFSIIVPVYNTENYLEKCLESIFKQTNQDFEVICINDGSTDNSLEVLNKYKEDIIIIDQKNQGLSEARNNGVKKASGKYILFIDSDDYIDKELLQKLDSVTKNNPDLVRFGVNEVIGDEIKPINAPKFNNISGTKAFEEIVKNKYVEPAWLYLYNKKFYLDNNFTFITKVYHEDFGLIPKVIVKAEKVTSIEFPGYYYVKREGSIINDPSKENKKILDLLVQGRLLLGDKELSKECHGFVANSLISTYNKINDKSKKKEYYNNLKELKISNYLMKDTFIRKIKYLICKISLKFYLKVVSR